MVEVIEDAVDVHDLIDFLLFLLNLDTLVSDELLGVGQVLNGLGSLHDFVLHEAERSSQLDGVVLGNLSNQLDVLLSDLLVLALVGIADVLAVDEEHGDLDLVRNAVKQVLLKLMLLHDIVADHLGSRSRLALLFLRELGFHARVRIRKCLVRRPRRRVVAALRIRRATANARASRARSRGADATARPRVASRRLPGPRCAPGVCVRSSVRACVCIRLSRSCMLLCVCTCCVGVCICRI